ncbi:MAG: hypothetical protein H6662_06215 [Ardenticatenaceae bacterium]|nr:hypothetical protein [Anaerolineales bacterium]MCB8921161.1 hypothetical protein [Ardenticatenaceae bacterium]MCB9004440.1 hypothetical protein [Ardenticatenaceae bacterium]
MTIRQNVYRLLLAGLLMAMLILPVMSVVADSGVAASVGSHSTLFQSDEQGLKGGGNVINDCSDGGSEGGCGV